MKYIGNAVLPTGHAIAQALVGHLTHMEDSLTLSLKKPNLLTNWFNNPPVAPAIGYAIIRTVREPL